MSKYFHLLTVSLFVIFNHTISAQWSTSGTNIYNNNLGIVGIGDDPSSFSLNNPKLFVKGNLTSQVYSLRYINTAVEAAFSHVFMTGDDDYAIAQGEDGYTKLNAATGFPIYFNIANSTKMILNSSGKLGIGTSNPSHLLTVNGEIKSKKLIVSANGWSDFVFYEDYKLMTLRDLELSIKKNKQLPDIPSEKDVLKNGIDIGEMQVKLLQKIEELTLYIIEQDKRIEALEKENKQTIN